MRFVKFCPMCKSSNVSFDARLETTYDVCRKCGYRAAPGVDFPEKEIKNK
ncbi:MAG: hypothetical protein AABY07_06765 [Nanoarchaeota archaeon]